MERRPVELTVSEFYYAARAAGRANARQRLRGWPWRGLGVALAALVGVVLHGALRAIGALTVPLSDEIQTVIVYVLAAPSIVFILYALGVYVYETVRAAPTLYNETVSSLTASLRERDDELARLKAALAQTDTPQIQVRQEVLATPSHWGKQFRYLEVTVSGNATLRECRAQLIAVDASPHVDLGSRSRAR